MKESRAIEWKESVSNSFLKTVSAFANYGSGSIVFGIADDGSVKGLADTRAACLDIENKVNDSMTPRRFSRSPKTRARKPSPLPLKRGRTSLISIKGKLTAGQTQRP